MVMTPTATDNNLPLSIADFPTLTEALDYAAKGRTGYNFYSGRGECYASLPYAELREQACGLARRLLGLGLERGARVALIAETNPDFPRFFFASQYAGLVPVPLPVVVSLGSREGYVAQLQRLLSSCRAAVAIAPDTLIPLLNEAAKGLNLRFIGSPEAFAELPESSLKLRPSAPDELAYLQYTSGSTRFPRGVMITQSAVMNNLAGIAKYGVDARPGDRVVSWLPYYHDMGLVGLLLTPLASQVSVDYLSTRDFAMRPRQWLALMTRNQATISLSPPFGYELCARRLRPEEAGRFDLRAWRVAGVGAETIRPEPLTRFAELLSPSGFDARAFLACYGMAECSLAVSFAPLDRGLQLDHVDADHLAAHKEALPIVDSATAPASKRVGYFVNCGKPLPGFEVAFRDDQGRPLPERHCGTLFVRGPSITSGYFDDPEATREALSPEGWLNTGDMGYRIQEDIVISGRKKDLIIINGRNIWPQDLEYLAEQQSKVRPGDALAFAVPGPDGEDFGVLVVQCRETEIRKRTELIDRLQGSIRHELGIDCFIDLVPPHVLPRTSSGKLSRSRARQEFLNRIEREGWKPLQTAARLPPQTKAG